ncbi:hypothetical protein G3R49_01330 [Shewanella sp. WXL01]|uniref:hypothetical protein n=1 Tax=Shewanella TaxID=22 RepID=UPI0013EE9702|nr:MULTISPECIES: hypothetical protein [Shewanella]NKF49219.1 hypothetical protein [Shewanella sp. WXL01]
MVSGSNMLSSLLDLPLWEYEFALEGFTLAGFAAEVFTTDSDVASAAELVVSENNEKRTSIKDKANNRTKGAPVR